MGAGPARRLPRLRTVLLGLVGVWIVVVVATLLHARLQLQELRDEVEALREDAAADALDPETERRLDRAAARLEALSGRLGRPWMRVLDVVPVAGRQLQTARAATGAAADVLATSSETLAAVRTVLDQPGALAAGPARIATLRELAAIARAGSEAVAAVDVGPGEGLVASVADARSEVLEQATDVAVLLARTSRAAEAMAALIERPGRYLLLVANNSQMQNGSGMFLSTGIVQFGGGFMDLAELEHVDDPRRPPVPAPLDADQAARWGWLDPNDDLRHLGVSARFPATAATADALWPALGHGDVDGVVAVDVALLAALVDVVGPLELNGVAYDGDAIARFLLHDQYTGIEFVNDPEVLAARFDNQTAVARQALDRLEALGALPDDVTDLARAAAGRHLLLWSEDPILQRTWEDLGVAGALGPESLLLGAINRSGSKLDWYLDLEAGVEVRPDGDVLDVAVCVRVTNRAPADGDSPYVIGPYPGSGLQPGEYLGVLTLTVPGAAGAGRVDGDPDLAVVGSEGPDNRVIGTRVQIGPGRSAVRVFRFQLPAAAADVRLEPSARARPTPWRFGERLVDDAGAHDIDLGAIAPGHRACDGIDAVPEPVEGAGGP